MIHTGIESDAFIKIDSDDKCTLNMFTLNARHFLELPIGALTFSST